MIMASYTPNLNLKKPATSDLVSIADINGNMDALDTAVANKLDADAEEIRATQFGGIDQTFTLKATGIKEIMHIKDATTYWKDNNGCAYIKCLIRYSTVAQGTTTATTTKMGAWLVEAVYSGTQHGLYCTEINANAGNATGVMRYFYSHAPKNTSYMPNLAIALYDASTTVYITVTILSASPGWEILSSIGGDPGTTNYNRVTWECGRYNYNWSSLKMATNITGSCDGTAGSTWNSIRNDRQTFGESAVAGSLMGLTADGKMYKLSDTSKEFVLPLYAGRSTGTFTYNGTVSPPTLSTYAQIMTEMRGMAYSELTNTSMQTTAFTVPTLAAGDWGKLLYLTGTLSNGRFKPDGNIVNTPQNGKTNILIGRIDRANQALDAVPTPFTLMGPSRTAYTLDNNGKLTHVDGKAIKDADTYTKAEVDALIAGQLTIKVVNSLPSTGEADTIYFVPASNSKTGNVKDEYAYINNAWELIGSTEFQLNITQNANGISINGTALQSASATQNGLMTSAQASRLASIAEGAEVNVQSDWNATSGDAFIKNKPTIPDELADLSDDSTHRTVTDSEKNTWNGKQAQHGTLSLSIATTAWSNKTVNITATGVTTSNTVIISPAPASITAWGDAGIKCTAQASNSLTFTCEEVPTSAISVNVVILG